MSVTAHVRNERQYEFRLGSGRYYALNVVGSSVWDLCKGGAFAGRDSLHSL